NQTEDHLKPVLYRLGERWPVWVAGDPNPKPEDLPFRGVKLPRLLGPLHASGISPEQVGFMVVLTNEPWIDSEDWIETAWRQRIFTYRRLPEAPWAGVFPALPELSKRAAEETNMALRYLRQQLADQEAHHEN